LLKFKSIITILGKIVKIKKCYAGKLKNAPLLGVSKVNWLGHYLLFQKSGFIKN
jgi:hypothetical protein